MAYRETAQVKARKAAQREALLRTAETLVREGGFAAMTMQTVADRAGVGVGTLYRYFDNKATLAAAVFAVATQREVDAVDRALAGGGAMFCGFVPGDEIHLWGADLFDIARP